MSPTSYQAALSRVAFSGVALSSIALIFQSGKGKIEILAKLAETIVDTGDLPHSVACWVSRVLGLIPQHNLL